MSRANACTAAMQHEGGYANSFREKVVGMITGSGSAK